jgi:catechol-2,3-dioxygenase
MNPIQGVRCVDVCVADMEGAASFYGGIWGLKEVTRQSGARFFRGTHRYHHILALYKSDQPSLRRIIFDAPDRSAVNQLHTRLASMGTSVIEEPRQLNRPGGGYGFGFNDPEGRNLAVLCGAQDYGASVSEPDQPHKITHVVLNSRDVPGILPFYCGVLGFRVIDESEAMAFLCCNEDHHSIALAHANASTLNHISFEMDNLDSVMRGAGRLKDHGYPIEWGPGRHGAGSNVFCYFAGPEELPIEYTAEVEQVDDSYVSHGPEYWKWPPKRTDRWGITEPRSPRLVRIQAQYRFSGDHWIEDASAAGENPAIAARNDRRREDRRDA